LPAAGGPGHDLPVQTLDGPAAVLAATGDHPYARFAVTAATDVRGIRDGDTVLWHGRSVYGPIGHGLGELSTVVDLLSRTAELTGVRWINLARHDPRPGYVRNEDWDYRWVTGPVPVPPGHDRVVPLEPDAAPAVDALLDLALPDSGVRPGSANVVGWYGIWADGELVACAADRSTRPGEVPPVGLIGGVAVHPAYRRLGLGAAVTAALTRRLLATHDLVGLGVAAENGNATRLYERLGYAGCFRITSIRPSTVDS
jgi:ribosomal protein S18 acetylase RimI-like enzyme